jgi:hypothetical protein
VTILLAILVAAAPAPAVPAPRDVTWSVPHMTFGCRLATMKGERVDFLVDFSGDQSANRFGFLSLLDSPWPGRVVFRNAQALSFEQAAEGAYKLTFAGARPNGTNPSSFRTTLIRSSERKLSLKVQLVHAGEETAGDCFQMPVLPSEVTEEPRQ